MISETRACWSGFAAEIGVRWRFRGPWPAAAIWEAGLWGRIAKPGEGGFEWEEVLLSLDEIMSEISGASIEKKAICAPDVLNEAPDYGSAFSRGLRLDLNGIVVLLISGTASVNENGDTVHIGDFRAQCRRTFKNITKLLEAEGASWKDIVRTTCYLRDIDRDYAEFNDERTRFFMEQGLDPLPASTGIQAKLCRPNLLVEIEAIAMFRKQEKPKQEG